MNAAVRIGTGGGTRAADRDGIPLRTSRRRACAASTVAVSLPGFDIRGQFFRLT